MFVIEVLVDLVSCHVESSEGMKFAKAWEKTDPLQLVYQIIMVMAAQVYTISSVAIGPHAPSFLAGYTSVKCDDNDASILAVGYGNLTNATAGIQADSYCGYELDRTLLWVTAVIM